MGLRHKIGSSMDTGITVHINCPACADEQREYNVVREHRITIGPFLLATHNEGTFEKAECKTICNTCGNVTLNREMIEASNLW